MCGRFVQKSDLRKIAPLFKVEVVESDLQPSFNVAPRQPIAVIMEDGKKKIVTMQWGLIPFWAKDPAIANKLINARAETLAEKPSFRHSFKSKRCLIIADGFYEWKKEGDEKRPMFITLKNGEPFCMAGLYDHWKSPDGSQVVSCAIVTTAANPFMEPIHSRMPVIVPAEAHDFWLDPRNTDVSVLQALLKPFEAGEMHAVQVSKLVNDPHHNSPDLILPIGG
jgi:putative SOS response-associated peptidase YedK